MGHQTINTHTVITRHNTLLTQLLVILILITLTMFYPELSPAMRWHLDHNQKMYNMQSMFMSGVSYVGLRSLLVVAKPHCSI